MKSENSGETWRIYNAALDLPSDRRRAFVESENADSATTREVFELLASLEEEDSEPSELPAVNRSGTQAGRYRVAELLGRGGMGEVYAAWDTGLDRRVALKFLRPAAIGDPAAVKRFIGEAKAASALNHPNILTIHEVIDSDGSLAIAMELVEGKPLSQLCGSPLALPQVIDIAKQAAMALAAAHEQGIVHRDIKPENLMMRPDGFLKVLDFGVARRFGPNSSTSASSVSAGTLRYMSPEQLRSEPLTGASDIFSLGLVLYELTAGHHPWESEYTWETAHKISTRDADPPSSANRDTPDWMDGLILAMLNRDAALRPAAGEVLEALSRERQVKQRTVLPEAPQAVLSRARARSWKWVLGTLTLCGLVGAVWLARDRLPPWQLKAVTFTDYPGDEAMPSFSPDGQKVAFVWSRNGAGLGNFDIYVRAIGSTSIEQITATPVDEFSLAWSPVDSNIAFLRKPAKEASAGLFIVSADGGPERKIADIYLTRYNNFAALGWTPDGKWILAPSQESEHEPVGLFLISPADGTKIRLTRPPAGQIDFDPAIAPGGRMLAFTRMHADSVFSIYLLPLSASFMAAGEPRALPSFPNLRVGSPQWTLDGKDLLFVANPRTGMAIWRMPVPESGEAPQPPRREVFAEPSFSISIGRISPAAHRLMYATEVLETNLWRVPIGTSSGRPALQRIGGASERNSGARISPDGSSVAFESARTGSTEIWIANIDGSKPRQLTDFRGPVTGSPAWSPDGRRIAFDSRAEGQPHIYVVAAAGGRPERITEALAENYLPSWSRDGRWIYFSSSRSGAVEVWRQPAAGGRAEQVTRGGGRNPIEAPDGAALYYERLLPGGWSLRRLLFETGEDVEVLPVIIDRAFELTRDGLYYVPVPGPDGRFSIQFLDQRTGVSRLVAPILKPMTRPLSVAPDGSFLLYSQFDRWGHDLMLVEKFR